MEVLDLDRMTIFRRQVKGEFYEIFWEKWGNMD